MFCASEAIKWKFNERKGYSRSGSLISTCEYIASLAAAFGILLLHVAVGLFVLASVTLIPLQMVGLLGYAMFLLSSVVIAGLIAGLWWGVARYVDRRQEQKTAARERPWEDAEPTSRGKFFALARLHLHGIHERICPIIEITKEGD